MNSPDSNTPRPDTVRSTDSFLGLLPLELQGPRRHSLTNQHNHAHLCSITARRRTAARAGTKRRRHTQYFSDVNLMALMN